MGFNVTFHYIELSLLVTWLASPPSSLSWCPAGAENVPFALPSTTCNVLASGNLFPSTTSSYHPLLQEKYTGREIARLLNMVRLVRIVQIFAIHSEYFRYASCLPSSEKKQFFFWENVPEAKKQSLLFAVYCEYLVPWPKYGHQKYNIWHLLTKSFPKIYTVWGHNGQFHYLWLFRAVQFPSSNSQI